MDLQTATVSFIQSLMNVSVTNNKTLLVALILAFFSAFLGAVGYFGNLVVTFVTASREERRLYQSAVIRFYNDIVIWQKDFETTYTDVAFERMARQIVDGGDDFAFSVPSSDQSDNAEIMKFIHRMKDPGKARLIRSFIIYSELLASIQSILGTEMAKFDKPRKMRALASFKETSEFVMLLASEAIDALKKERFLKERKKKFENVLSQQIGIRDKNQLILEKNLALLPPVPTDGKPPQSSGGSGPDIVDLREFVKLAHKIANAYRSFNSSN